MIGLWEWQSGRPKFFSLPTPFAQNAIRPGSVGPPLLFVQDLFTIILCMNNKLWLIIGICANDNAIIVYLQKNTGT